LSEAQELFTLSKYG
jgi:hypothetical protein